MTIRKIIDTLQGLEMEGGATFKCYQPASYDSGYQVSKDDSLLLDNLLEIEIRYDEVKKFILQAGGCIGLYKGINGYYIDRSFRVMDKQEALEIAKKYNQESIYDWSSGTCINTL